MQAVMLAAGMGKRLGKYTQGNTKCMVDVAGKTLIERAVNALKDAGVTKLIMVVGYQMDNLKEFISTHIQGIEIVYIDNFDYEKSNNIYSLYLARSWLKKDDTILLESDLIYEPSIIQGLLDCEYRDVVVAAKYEQWMDGTVITIDNEDNVIDFIEKKDFLFEHVVQYYKTVNIYKFSKEFSSKQYVPFLEAYIKAYGKDGYYELALKAIAHLSHSGLKALKLTGQKWYEIDDAQDLDIAGCLFSNQHDELRLYQNRFGGYWRFKSLKDFCYLVNPYFPPKSLVDKIKFMFQELITQYPSGLNTQNINASRMYTVDESRILVGNGAAELINVLGRLMKGTVALSIPTFNEYVRCFPNCEFIQMSHEDGNYSYETRKIYSAIDKADTIILISPDNPSGDFIKYEDMMEIIKICDSRNKKIIIDESFADFMEKGVRYSLLDDNLLQKHKNLIVIKSISKSYGVPGLRLGILASGDLNLIKKIRDNLAIWNINSFAEYFLQIINLYSKEYFESCRLVAEERNRFYLALSKLNYLYVYPSQANYFLCHTKGVDSSALAEWLLINKNILIKDLSGKDGFPMGQYIRIAVKSSEDNDFLINALGEYPSVAH